MNRLSSIHAALASAFAIGLVAPTVAAALIAEENFDYGVADQPLVNLNGGAGWSGAWDAGSRRTQYDADVNVTPAVTGYSNAGNIGGSATLGAGSDSIHIRQFTTAATTVWFSAAVFVDESTDRILLWIDSTTAAANSGDIIGVSEGTSFYRYNNTTTTGTAAAPVGTPFLLVAKAEINVSGSNDRLSFWFNPSDTTSEATLGTPTLTDAGANTFGDEIGGIAIQFFGSGLTGGHIDAIRVGTTLQDVTAIPEPATLALAATGGVLVASRRRGRP